MTFEEFSARNLRRCVSPVGFNHPLSAWSLADWLLAAAGELGEAMNVAKKINRERDGITGNDRSGGELWCDLLDELADAVIYLDLVAHSRGIKLSEKLAEAQAAWGEFRFGGIDLSGDFLAILVTFGSIAGITNQMDARAPTVTQKDLEAALGEYLGIATRRIFAVMSSRGYDPIVALEIKFLRTSAKIGYVEPEEITGDGSGEALPPIESSPVGRVCASGDCAGGGGSLTGREA